VLSTTLIGRPEGCRERYFEAHAVLFIDDGHLDVLVWCKDHRAMTAIPPELSRSRFEAEPRAGALLRRRQMLLIDYGTKAVPAALRSEPHTEAIDSGE
jgi:hypothetical protein